MYLCVGGIDLDIARMLGARSFICFVVLALLSNELNWTTCMAIYLNEGNIGTLYMLYIAGSLCLDRALWRRYTGIYLLKDYKL